MLRYGGGSAARTSGYTAVPASVPPPVLPAAATELSLPHPTKQAASTDGDDAPLTSVTTRTSSASPTTGLDLERGEGGCHTAAPSDGSCHTAEKHPVLSHPASSPRHLSALQRQHPAHVWLGLQPTEPQLA